MRGAGMTDRGTWAWILRPGDASARAVRIDVLWLVVGELLLIGCGVGLRDPWPADEPRFVLIARDMLATGNWLVPIVGGDLYQDKPPLFFWLLAAGNWLTGSMRIGFLLPSLLASVGTLLLVYDLGRRFWGRTAGFAGALALLFTVQFFWQGRQAQIDATLCFFVTLSLYGLLRHLILGSHWGWYAGGWVAAGFGVITKGVGFLPLLVLIPYLALRGAQWRPRPVFRGGWRWWLGPLGLAAAVGIWLVPVLILSLRDPALAAYRDEILFKQTLERYGNAWQHREPLWYFVVEVIPFLWLPVTALLPWLVPEWRRAVVERDLRTALPLIWVVIVVVFFSLSSGKRGVYVLPALPALALVTGPALVKLMDHRAPARMLYALTIVVVAIVLGTAAYAGLADEVRQRVLSDYGLDPLAPLLVGGAIAAALLVVARPARGFLAYGCLAVLAMFVTGLWINLQLNAVRSGNAFAREVEARTRGVAELALVGYREQYLLELRRSTFNFGHSRWLEAEQEAADAAAWLTSAPGRAVLVNDRALEACFDRQAAEFIIAANRARWYLVVSGARHECVMKGRLAAAREYDPRDPPRLGAVLARHVTS